MEIYPLDLNFKNISRAIAAYLVVGPEGPVLLETGPASTLKTLIARLAEHGYTPNDIQHVLLTHIHLDHAGAAYWWARRGAQVYAHYIGAPHLINPTRLLASARLIFGDATDRLWGDTLPAPAERVHPLKDGDTIEVRGLRFVALNAPGHAFHHHVYRLGDIAFTGDATAVRVSENPFISLPATPPEFDLEAWQETLTRLKNQRFATLYPTHFGPVHDVNAHIDALADLMDRAAAFVHARMKAGLSREALEAEYGAWVHARASSQGLSEREFQVHETVNPSSMSVDGIMSYWGMQTG